MKETRKRNTKNGNKKGPFRRTALLKKEKHKCIVRREISHRVSFGAAARSKIQNRKK